MALIQRYSTELSTHVGSNRQMHDDRTGIAQVVNDVAAIKRQDEDEKRYLHSLNDRLENLLGYLDGLEVANKKLRDDLNSLILNWGIGDRAQFLKELDDLTRHLSETNRRKIIFQVETKLFEEQAQLTDRITALFRDVYNSYQDKNQLVFDLINQLEGELYKIQVRLNISNAQVKSHDDDYQKELAKFRSYLAEWSQIALAKQTLLNEIQSLKERYNLRLAYNQEEINEWKRLLDRISQESKNFYRDYLETIKQQIQMDYEQMAKEQQTDVEIELKSRLKAIEDQIHSGLPIDENDARRRREETHRFESRLNESAKEHDRLQSDYRTIAEENQRKRRILQDLENEARNKARQNAERRSRLEQETDLTRAEYYALKDELDKLVYTLRFSIEEELKIYEALLNSVHRQKQVRPPIDESTGFRRSETTIIDNSTNYRPPPPPSTTTEMTSTTYAAKNDGDRYGISRSMLDENQTKTTTTTRTKRRFGHDNDGPQQININMNRSEQNIPELDEKYLQSKLHITRKYKGNILIKFVDVNGRFVEIENTGNQSRDLTGWYIERTVDGRRLNYTFPVFELDSHKTVRIYGNYHQQSSSSSITDDSYVQLIAPNLYDWGTGLYMRTELFNRDEVGKALFEQTIKD